MLLQHIKGSGNPNKIPFNIEQKMCSDDCKVWSRGLEREAEPATYLNLFNCMTVKMKSRMRATVPNGSSILNHWSMNVIYGETYSIGAIWHRCWFCSNLNHWPDQCDKLAVRNVDGRISGAKTHYVCLSCLKKAGRDHRQGNCSRIDNVRKSRMEPNAPQLIAYCCTS